MDSKKRGRLALVFNSFIVFAVALVWLISGIYENSGFIKRTAVVTAVSEMSTENTNMYDQNYQPIGMAYAHYEYYIGSVRHTDSLSFYDGYDEYSVGDEIILYFHRDHGDIWYEENAVSDMLDNTVPSFLFVIISSVVMVCGIKKMSEFIELCMFYKSSVIISLIIAGACTAYTVYMLFFYDSFAMYFAGLAELMDWCIYVFLIFIGIITNSVVSTKV